MIHARLLAIGHLRDDAEFCGQVENRIVDWRKKHTRQPLPVDIKDLLRANLNKLDWGNAMRIIIAARGTDSDRAPELFRFGGICWMFWTSTAKSGQARLFPSLLLDDADLQRRMAKTPWEYATQGHITARWFSNLLNLPVDIGQNWERKLWAAIIDNELDRTDGNLRTVIDAHFPRGRLAFINCALGHTLASDMWASYLAWSLKDETQPNEGEERVRHLEIADVGTLKNSGILCLECGDSGQPMKCDECGKVLGVMRDSSIRRRRCVDCGEDMPIDAKKEDQICNCCLDQYEELLDE